MRVSACALRREDGGGDHHHGGPGLAVGRYKTITETRVERLGEVETSLAARDQVKQVCWCVERSAVGAFVGGLDVGRDADHEGFVPLQIALLVPHSEPGGLDVDLGSRVGRERLASGLRPVTGQTIEDGGIGVGEGRRQIENADERRDGQKKEQHEPESHPDSSEHNSNLPFYRLWLCFRIASLRD